MNMTVSVSEVKFAIGEAYSNMGVEGDTDANRDTIVTALIGQAEDDITDITGTATGYDTVILPLACAYCVANAAIGQGPNTLGQDPLTQAYERFLQRAKNAANRKGFRLEGSQFSIVQVNN